MSRERNEQLIDALGRALDRLVDEKMQYNYADEEHNRSWTYDEFFTWLIEKYKADQKVR